MENINYVVYSVSRNTNKPLDYRNEISSIVNFDGEIPVNYRYYGMIIFVKDKNTYYTLIDDLITLVPLSSTLLKTLIYHVKQQDTTNYSNLLTTLNSFNQSSSVGRIITVFPLRVSFIFDGTTWKYHSGEYNVENPQHANTIPSTLRKPHGIINVSSSENPIPKYYLFNVDGTINDLLRTINSIDVGLSFQQIVDNNSIPGISWENQRYYLIDNILFYRLNNKMFRIGNNIFINYLVNIKLFNQNEILFNPNSNIINHNLNSTYLCVYFEVIVDNIYDRVNNVIVPIKKIFNLDYWSIDSNNIQIYSDIPITISGKLIVTQI